MEHPPPAQVKRRHRDMRGILGRIIGEFEESLTHRRCGRVTVRRVPHVHAEQALHPVIGRAIERQHIKPRLDECDEGQEMFAVEAVLIELSGRAVRRGDNRHARFDQRGKQPRHDHRVGRIIDDHFVKVQAFGLCRKRIRDRQDRVAQLLLPLGPDTRVNLDHEFVEVNAALRFDAETLMEQVHQHRFAAPDPAPQVDAARAFRLLAEDAPDDAALLRDGFEFGLKLIEPGSGSGLLGVCAQFARCDEFAVAGEDRSHPRADGLRMVPE